MTARRVATSTITIEAPPSRVWDVSTDTESVGSGVDGAAQNPLGWSQRA